MAAPQNRLCQRTIDGFWLSQFPRAPDAIAQSPFQGMGGGLLNLPAVLIIVVVSLILMRGIKESVAILTPIFLLFLVTHAILIIGAIATNLGNAGGLYAEPEPSHGCPFSLQLTLPPLSVVFLKPRSA